jgi:hypothetical protein
MPLIDTQSSDTASDESSELAMFSEPRPAKVAKRGSDTGSETEAPTKFTYQDRLWLEKQCGGGPPWGWLRKCWVEAMMLKMPQELWPSSITIDLDPNIDLEDAVTIFRNVIDLEDPEHEHIEPISPTPFVFGPRPFSRNHIAAADRW